MASQPTPTPPPVAKTSTLADLARFAAEHDRKPVTVTLLAGENGKTANAFLVPDGFKIEPTKPILDAFRTRPELRSGTTTLLDLASFVAWTARHKDDGSVVFAVDDMTAPSLTAIIDHDEPGADAPDTKARFGRHRGEYAFPLSREWKEWRAACREGMNATAFAAFFERRIADVMPPPYSVDGAGQEFLSTQDPEIRKLAMILNKKFATVAEIVRLTRGIEINVDAKAVQKIDRDTGEHTIEFAEENGQGVDKVKPPNAFLIAIPVLANGGNILMAVHLRYRPAGGKITWFLELHQPDRVFEEVFRGSLAEVAEGTGLVPLRGKPPAAR
ncbi:MAG: DUF2303 family protein [Alphaproteobacteria bacterium]|nr:DUF2303 family protein [Alphaproteobacteria bacterium]